MCVNPFYFNDAISQLVSAKVEYFHLDVMDGHFVPNLGIGLDWINKLRSVSDISCDFHLMTLNPDRILPLLALRPGDIVSVHYESTLQVLRVLELVKSYNVRVFLAINPGTPISVLDELIYFVDGVNLLMVNPWFAGQKMVPFALKKAERLINFISDANLDNFSVEVDGNITVEKARALYQLGASIFVAGTSSIFSQTGIREGALDRLREAIS